MFVGGSELEAIGKRTLGNLLWGRAGVSLPWVASYLPGLIKLHQPGWACPCTGPTLLRNTAWGLSFRTPRLREGVQVP